MIEHDAGVPSMSTSSLNLVRCIATFALVNALNLSVSEAEAQYRVPEQPSSIDYAEYIGVVTAVRATAGSHGVTELMVAVSNENLDKIRSLVESGADLNAINKYGHTALSWAVGIGNVQITKALLEAGAESNVIAKDGTSPLSTAVRDGAVEISLALLEYGADPNTHQDLSYSTSPLRQSVLAIAARRGRAKTVDALIDAGVDIETDGGAALAIAASQGSTKIVTALMRAGVSATTPSEGNGSTSLHAAAAGGHADIAKILLSVGSDPNLENNSGQTPLFFAVQKNDVATVNVLIEHGAVPTTRQLIDAVRQDNDDIIGLLLPYIDTTDIGDADRVQMLEMAENTNKLELIATLLPFDKLGSNSRHSAKFLYARSDEANSSCTIMLWDPIQNTNASIYSSGNVCGGRLSVSEDKNLLFVLSDNEIRIVSTDDGTDIEIVLMPKDLLAEIDQLLMEKFRQKFGDGYDQYARGYPRVTGYLRNGELALLTSASGPADGTYSYLLVRHGDTWELVDEQTCGRFARDCRFGQIESRRMMDWPRESAASHPYIRMNTFFVAKSSVAIEGQYRPVSRERLDFEFGDKKSTLTYEVFTSGHCSGDCTFVGEVALERAMGIKSLSKASWNSISIVDRFVLLGQSNDGLELFDMETGDSIFGPLQVGTWIQ